MDISTASTHTIISLPPRVRMAWGFVLGNGGGDEVGVTRGSVMDIVPEPDIGHEFAVRTGRN
ncbi:hypothetical protein GCM10011273_04940 [Asticcacaulis endophyticus]|uniref:Uncharacterized protein n=1 Tax=Asticcacaulis endophyticus TaxID=1395890 RepID=A0A918UNL4_9CAUL|nr:hypothetical protein GCM10011273_04940 [Asticcacaulis endophyticus]